MCDDRYNKWYVLVHLWSSLNMPCCSVVACGSYTHVKEQAEEYLNSKMLPGRLVVINARTGDKQEVSIRKMPVFFANDNEYS